MSSEGRQGLDTRPPHETNDPVKEWTTMRETEIRLFFHTEMFTDI